MKGNSGEYGEIENLHTCICIYIHCTNRHFQLPFFKIEKYIETTFRIQIQNHFSCKKNPKKTNQS